MGLVASHLQTLRNDGYFEAYDSVVNRVLLFWMILTFLGQGGTRRYDEGALHNFDSPKARSSCTMRFWI